MKPYRSPLYEETNNKEEEKQMNRDDLKEFNNVQLTDRNVAAGPIGKIIEDLEKRVAALEVLVQIQPTAKDKIDLPSLLDRVVEELRKEARKP